MINPYTNLPYMHQQDFEFCEYAKASALRVPIRDAINTARAMPPAKMQQVIEVLETALEHIHRGTPDATFETTAPTTGVPSGDALSILLGPPSENESDAS